MQFIHDQLDQGVDCGTQAGDGRLGLVVSPVGISDRGHLGLERAQGCLDFGRGRVFDCGVALQDAEGIPGVDLIYDVAMVTVLFSIYVHGVTAAPGAKWYGRRMAELDEEHRDVGEMNEVSEMPLRVTAKP